MYHQILPSDFAQRLCRTFKPATGNLEEKTPILAKRPKISKIFIAYTFLSCRAFCANIRPPLSFHSTQVFFVLAFDQLSSRHTPALKPFCEPRPLSCTCGRTPVIRHLWDVTQAVFQCQVQRPGPGRSVEQWRLRSVQTSFDWLENVMIGSHAEEQKI